MASNLDAQDKVTGAIDAKNANLEAKTWQLNALTAALGDLTLTVDDSLSVGRGSDNDVVLGSKQVSRNHALLSVLNGKLYIKDLDSSNGTFINDARIEGNKSKHLQADDTVGFASFVFQVAAPVVTDDVNVAQPVLEEVTTEAAPIIEATPAAVTPAIIADKAINSEVIDTEKSVVTEQNVATNTVETASTKEPAAEPTIAKEVAKEITPSVAEPAITEPAPIAPVESLADEPVVTTTTIAADKTTAPEQVINDSQAAKPVVKDTIIEEVLSATASDTVPIASPSTPSTATEQEPVLSSNEPSTATLTSEPLIEEPVAQEPVPKATTPEQDKTTKTELQEEADPDVLRAKQAATGQLSGTANLGQAPDIGTEGNNAMSQALNNPANAGHVEKKPSGGWFIWVFVAIIIIGLALWLFNMGG